MQVAIPLFPRFTALDGIGPYEVLQRIPSIDVTFVGHQRGEVRSENGMLGITIDATFDELPTPTSSCSPAASAPGPLVHDERVLDWVRAAHESTTLHDIGVHRFAGARRRRPAERPDRHDPLGVLPGARGDRRDADGTARRRASRPHGSSPPPGSPAGSTWRCGSSNCWSIARPPRQRS